MSTWLSPGCAGAVVRGQGASAQCAFERTFEVLREEFVWWEELGVWSAAWRAVSRKG